MFKEEAGRGMYMEADWSIHKCFYLELDAAKLLWPTYDMKLNET